MHWFCKGCDKRVPVSIADKVRVECSSRHVLFDVEEEYLAVAAGGQLKPAHAYLYQLTSSASDQQHHVGRGQWQRQEPQCASCVFITASCLVVYGNLLSSQC